MATITKSVNPSKSDTKIAKKITVFHCINSLDDTASLNDGDYEAKLVKMPCSSMTREVFLLRAFEAGADAVVVLVCPEGACRYLQGNTRAKKRVNRVKKLLDEIGIGGKRLNIYNIRHNDQAAVSKIIEDTLSNLVSSLN